MIGGNGFSYFASIGLARHKAVSQVKLPVKGLSAVECREAVSAILTSRLDFYSEAQALLQPQVAVAYLEETTTACRLPKAHERR